MFLICIEFFFVAAVVVFSGSRLTFYADAMSVKTGLGRTWTGLILLASMTSLPELITGASSVTAVNGPDIAVGDILGSCVFNLTIIAVLDLYYRPGPVLSKAGQGHIISAGFGIVSLVVVGMGLFAAQKGFDLGLFWIGPYTPTLFFLYFRGMAVNFRYEKRKAAQEHKAISEHEKYAEISRRRVFGGFAFHAALIVGFATLLPYIGKQLSEATGWGQSFVGLILIALATSLPEVATSLAAVRIGAFDLALANLFGSNMFNLMILGIDDLLFMRGPLLAKVSTANIMPVLSAVLISGIAILNLFYRPQPRFNLRVTWLALTIFLIYALNASFVFLLETR